MQEAEAIVNSEDLQAVKEADAETLRAIEFEGPDRVPSELQHGPVMVSSGRPPPLKLRSMRSVASGTLRSSDLFKARRRSSHEQPNVVADAADEVVAERSTAKTADSAASGIEEERSRRIAVLSEAAARVRELTDEASAARARDTALHPAPPRPHKSTRRDQLRALACPPSRPEVPPAYRSLLNDVDSGVSRIAAEVTNNPLWMAADYLERHTRLGKVDDELAKHERMQRAEKAYQRAEKAVLAAKSQLDRWRRGPRWARAADRLLPRGWRMEARRHVSMARASQHLVKCEVERRVVEADARAELGLIVGERNGKALAKQKEARSQRDNVERHLREAVIHRHLGERIVENHRPVQHLKDAPLEETLEYVGMSRIGPFRFEEFRAGDRVYIADAVEVREPLERLDLARGDRVAVRGGSDQLLTLEIKSRGDVWSGTRSISGDLVEIDRVGNTVRGIKLRDVETNAEKWVRPREGDDLGKDLSPVMLGALRVGDQVMIEGKSIFVRPARCQDRGR